MGVEKVGQVKIDSSAFLRQRNPVHHRLYGTIAQNPNADSAAMQICGGFEGFDARTGIVQIHTHNGTELATHIAVLIISVGKIGLVLCLELLAGKAAAVVHLAHKCWEVGVAHAKLTVGLPILVGGNIYRLTDAQPQVASNRTDRSRPHRSVKGKKKIKKGTLLTQPRHGSAATPNVGVSQYPLCCYSLRGRVMFLKYSAVPS